MSRTNRSEDQSGSKSPVTQYIEWSGAEGKFKTWSKEKEENVFFPKIDKAILLEVKTCVTGYDDGREQGIISNEVKSIKKEEIIVKTQPNKNNKKEVELYRGFYKKDFGSIVPGAKYTQVLYLAMPNKDGVYTIVKLTLAGSGLGNLFELRNDNDLYDHTLTIKKGKQQKKGSVKFFPTEITLGPLTDEEVEIADDLDETLSAYFAGADLEEVEEEPAAKDTPTNEGQDVEDEEDDDDLPF